MTLPDIADLDTYGGAKQNYAPVEDALTDESAEDRNEYVSDVAGMTQTLVRAWVSFVGNATTPTDPSIDVHGACWGNTNDVKPTLARTGTGVWTATWPATIEDALGVVRSIRVRRAFAFAEGTTPYLVTATPTANNVVTIRIFNTSGVANDGVGVTFTVCWF